MIVEGICATCKRKTQLWWDTRSRASAAWQERVCHPCALILVRIKDMFIEQIPYSDKHEKDSA